MTKFESNKRDENQPWHGSGDDNERDEDTQPWPGSINIILVVLILFSTNVFSDVFDHVTDDQGLNEVTLMSPPPGAGWATQGNIVMGAEARGDATPSWWDITDTSYKDSDPWNAVTPWIVIYPGENHTATNVRVKVSNLELYILKHSTDLWELVNPLSTDPVGEFHQDHISPGTAAEAVNKRTEPDGKISYKLNAGLNPIHAWPGKFVIDGVDVKAVYARVITELILDDENLADDRQNAELTMSIGGDYYPDVSLVVADFAAPYDWVPAIAASRFGLITEDRRIHHMATIDPPGAISSGSVLPNTTKTITSIAFEANPPPALIIPATSPFTETVDQNKNIIIDTGDYTTPPSGETIISTQLITDVSNGTIIHAGGLFVYTPTPGSTVDDSFVFTATDSGGGVSANTTVTITVNEYCSRCTEPICIIP